MLETERCRSACGSSADAVLLTPIEAAMECIWTLSAFCFMYVAPALTWSIRNRSAVAVAAVAGGAAGGLEDDDEDDEDDEDAEDAAAVGATAVVEGGAVDCSVAAAAAAASSGLGWLAAMAFLLTIVSNPFGRLRICSVWPSLG